MPRRSATLLAFLWQFFFAASCPVLSEDLGQFAHDWQVHSFYDDADLAEKYVSAFDFTADGNVWLAVSDGLYFFDGLNWTRYSTKHGLPSNYVRCVTVTSRGTLWVGTDRGAGIFKNGSFSFAGTQGNLAGPSIRRIVEDPDGSIWFCCDQWPRANVTAGLTRFRAGEYTSWRAADGLPCDYVSDYFRDSQGRQFVLTRQGLAQFTPAGFRLPLLEAGLTDANSYIWSLIESPEHGLIAATSMHFYQLRNDGSWRRLANDLLSQPKLVATSDGEVFAMSHGAGPALYRWKEQGFQLASAAFPAVVGDAQMLREDSEGAIWIAGFERLLKWDRRHPEWTLIPDVGDPQLRDSHGGIWFDNAEDGVVRLFGDRWESWSELRAPIVEDKQGRVWLETAGPLAQWERGQVRMLEVPQLPSPRLGAVDAGGHLWVHGTTEKGAAGVACFAGDTWSFTELPGSSQQSVSVMSSDLAAGVWLVLGKHNLPPFRLLHVDATGVTETSFPPAAQVSQAPKLLMRQDGSLMLAGFFGLLESSNRGNLWTSVKLPSPAVAQLIDVAGEAWVGCMGNVGGKAAILRHQAGHWQRLPKQQGCIAGHDERHLYVTNHGSIQIIPTNAAAQPPPITTPFFSQASSVIRGQDGEIWVASRKQAYRYTPNQTVPDTEIIGGDRRVYHGDDLVLTVRGREPFIPRGQTRAYFYSTQMDGGPWTSFQAASGKVRIAVPRRGLHEVRVRVQDQAGQQDPTPASFEFRVLPVPLQLRPWFVPAVIASFTAMFGLALMAVVNWGTIRRLATGLEREVDRKTKRLQKSEQRYRVLFEDSQDAICLFDNDGHLLMSNGAAQDLLDLSSTKRLDMSAIFADEREARRFREELRSRGIVVGSGFRIRRRDGDVADAIISANTSTPQVDRPPDYQLIIRDISDVVQLQQRLSEAQKMEAIGRMAGGIAHDFNNFLAVVMYGADFVQMSENKDAHTRKGLEMILDGVDRARNLTSQIQTFSRRPTKNLDMIDTSLVLSRIPGLLKGILPSHVALELDVPHNLGPLPAESHQLEQIVLNLTVNACHAMPAGGTLNIRAAHCDVDVRDATELGLKNPGPYVRLHIADSGEGMEPDVVERIFEPFYTTKPSGQGTGLGLAIVYGIVQQLGGGIHVQSRPGGGTSFQLYFPICQQESANAAAHEQTEEVPSGFGNETLLLVEDEAQLRESARTSLQHYGYTVEAAPDCRTARTLLERGTHFDLVISDVMMNGSSGWELVKHLRASQPDIAILMISGYPESRHLGRPEQLEVPLLEKPFHPNALAKRVRQILDQRSSLCG